MASDNAHDYAFEMAASAVRFGVGVTREVGGDLAELGARKVLVVTDAILRGLTPVGTVIDALD
jgi:hydroxyacid-oxoacid transhydrogenase